MELPRPAINESVELFELKLHEYYIIKPPFGARETAVKRRREFLF